MSVNSFIAKCTCIHEGQDKIHGRGNRVFNLGKSAEKGKCTVCGSSVGKPKSVELVDVSAIKK